MKSFVFLFCFFSILSSAKAQKVYFVYLQSENNTPFRAKMNEQWHNSSDNGFLILSKLVNNTYPVQINTTGDKIGLFNVVVDHKDQGYILKSSSDNELVLQDLQSSSMLASVLPKSEQVVVKKEVSGFTDVLSKTANDPSLKEIEPDPEAERKAAEALKKLEDEEAAKIKKEREDEEARIKKEQEAEEKRIKTAEKLEAAKNKTEREEEAARRKEAQDEEDKKIKIAKAQEAARIKKAEEDEKAAQAAENTKVAVEEKAGEPKVEEKPVSKRIRPKKVEPIADEEPKEEKAIVAVEPPKEEKVAEPNVEKDTEKAIDVATRKVANQEKKNLEPSAIENFVYIKSTITKKSERPTSLGIGVTYEEKFETGETESIEIFIPEPPVLKTTQIEKTEPEKDVIEVKDIKKLDAVEEQPTAKEKSEPTENMPQAAAKEKTEVVNEMEEKPSASPSRKECSSVADNDDFLKLRKKMVSANNDNGMIDVAEKALKSKCYSTTQIKNLSVLFLNDAGKYKFFDMAYPFVSDPERFPSMDTGITDEYYYNRFKSMLRQ